MLTYKEKISKNFSKAAASYDLKAVVQREMGQALVDTIRRECPKANSILDLGTGTGFLIGEVSCLYPDAKIYGIDIAPGMVEASKGKFEGKKNISIVQGDIEDLPFPENSFDLAISSASLQWIKNLENVFKQISVVLTQDGVFYVNLFGEKTFEELKLSLKSVGLAYPFSFMDKKTLQDLLEKTGFISNIESRIFCKYYPDLMSFLKKVKEIGAGNIFPLKNNLGQRKLLSDMEKHFRTNDSQVAITYELISFKATLQSRKHIFDLI